MGFFSSIKDNLHRGGVKVSMVAPDQFDTSTGTITAQLTLLSESEVKLINSISIKLVRIDNDRGPSSFDNDTTNSRQEYILAENKVDSGISLQPGQPVNTELSLSVNFGSAIPDSLEDNSLVQGIAKTANVIQAFENKLHLNSSTFELRASADVEGIALDPSASMNIQIVGSGI